MSEMIPVKDVTPPNRSAAVTVDPRKPSDGLETVTFDLYEKRRKIYVREVKGFYQVLRKYSLWALMGLYFITCWATWNGQQLVLFDLPNRQFHLFGTTFFPQDFILLSWMLIICAFGLFFVTTLFGRVWCGYTCPQTAWTFIFMWFEERIEGSRNKRIKLDEQPNSLGKVSRKVLKHVAWLAVAFATGFTFVGYFTPVHELALDLVQFNVGGWAAFWILFFTAATYINAGWMREQVCLYMCPYARFQSVMFDEDTWVVAYDARRGEPRGGRKKETDTREAELGDCVDCGMCVQVCPTGIDIRDGLQYECINCGLCIDACDQVMEKMAYPKGLIRYATEHELEGNTSHLFKARSIGYGLLLAAMIGAVAYSIATRVPLQLDVIRDRGALFSINSQGEVENTYSLQVLNMAGEARSFTIELLAPEGFSLIGNTRISLRAGEIGSRPLRVAAPPALLQRPGYPIEFRIVADQPAEASTTAESRFMAPPPARK